MLLKPCLIVVLLVVVLQTVTAQEAAATTEAGGAAKAGAAMAFDRVSAALLLSFATGLALFFSSGSSDAGMR